MRFLRMMGEILRECNVISTNDGANSKRRQRDFYERVVQIPGECNVISINGVRMEWEA